MAKYMYFNVSDTFVSFKHIVSFTVQPTAKADETRISATLVTNSVVDHVVTGNTGHALEIMFKAIREG